MKRLVLAGGGHAHLRVLAEIGKRPLQGWQVDLVSPHEHQIYSGMLPGWIAGHHPLSACLVPLRPLAERAGIAFHLTAATALDMPRNALQCDNGRSLNFDALSLDVGPAPALDGLVLDSADVLPIRPLAGLVDAWPRLMERIGSQCKPFHLVIVGAGAGGLELALSVHHRAMREGWSHLKVTLVGADDSPLAGAPERARALALALLVQRGIGWQGQRRVERIQANEIAFTRQPPLRFDACWLATGAAAPTWLRSSGLDLDARGFVRVTQCLQSRSHSHVFAAGDVASPEVSPPPPKSGVYAVRAGLPLAHNLRAICTGQPLVQWKPQQRALYLVSTGDRNAIGIWGAWSWQGRWAWRWKSRIDHAFVSRYAG
ncbi:MAG: FAD-dependent oxidoreductase [Pseudomonadota bacterium]